MPDGTDIPDDIRGLVAERQAARATANAAGASTVQPQAAQGALRNAPLSGVPASVGMHSPEVGQQAADSARAQAVLAASPSVQSFVASDPAKAAATQPDWYSFGQIASDFNHYVGPVWNSIERHRTEQASNPLLKYIQDPVDVFNLFGATIGGVTSAATSPIARNLAQVAPLTAVDRGDGLTTFGFGLTHAPGSRPATPEESAGQYEAIPQGAAQVAPIPFFPRIFRRGPVQDLGLAREVVPEGPLGPNRGLTGPEGSVPPPRPSTPPPEVPASVEPSPFTTEPTAPPGVHAEEAPFFEAEANTNEAVVRGLQERVAETETHTSAPALVEDFLTNHTGMGDTPVWVNPQMLAQLWQEGHTPFAAYTPQIADALQTGRDVQVPLSTYLTETAGKPFADQLNAATRFAEGGVSQEEAKGLGGQAGEAAPALEVHVPEDLAPHEAEVRSIAAGVEEAVSQVFKAHGIEGLFADAKAAGLTKPQFDRYGQHIDALRSDLRQRLLERTYAQLRRERTPAYKAQLDAIEPFQRQLIEQHPDVGAMRALGQTGMKLDRGAVEAFYPGAASRLPASILKNNGNHPDAAADLLGYDSGAQLVNNLADLADGFGGKGLNAWVKAAAMDAAKSQARTNLGYDPSPEGLLRAAREMLVESPMESYLTEDLRNLAKESGLPFSRADVKAFAARQFEALPVKEATNPRTFERGMWRTGEETQKALEKGDWAGAFKGRQAQLINYLQLQMSHAAAKTWRAANGTLSRWAGADTVAGTDPTVGAILQQAAADLGFRLGRDPDELGRYLSAAEDAGLAHDIPSLNLAANGQGWPLDLIPQPPLPLTSAPWASFTSYMDQLKALQKYGAELHSITSQGKAWDLAAFSNEVAANADALGRKYTPQQLHDARSGAWNRLKNATQSLLVGNLRPEVYLHWVDGDKQGPLMGLVNQLQGGKYLETDLSSGWVEGIKAAVPENFWKQMHEKVDAPEGMMVDTVNGRVNVMQTRGNLRHALLYLGSETGRMKLLEGYHWGPEAEGWLKANATAEDWAFVKEFWKQSEGLFTKADAMYARLRGYGLTKDELRPVETGHPTVGTLPGGHVHVTYDPTLKDRMRVQEVEPGLKATYGTMRPGGDVMSEFPASALPSAFYGIQRTGYTGPVMLDPRALSAGVAEVIHDIAYREALVNAQKGLTHPIVKDALETVLGPEYAKQMMPWLRYIAQERMLYDPSTNALVRGINTLTSNFVWAEVAYNVASALKHTGVGAIHMLAEVKNPLALAKAASDVWGVGPKASMWRGFVEENSGEVRGLRYNNDASLSAMLQQDAFTGGALGAYKDLGYGLFTLSKYFEAQATWLAKYRTAIAENGDHGLSVSIADKAVRDTQGAGHPVDLAPLLRRSGTAIGQVGRFFAGKLMGFRNTGPNRLFTAKRQFGQGEYGKAGVGVGAFVIGAALWIAFQEVFIRGGGDPKAKTRADAFKEEAGWALAENSIGAIVGPNALLDPIHFGSGQTDKLKAATMYLKKGEVDKIHGAWAMGLGLIGQATGLVPVSAGKLIQAIDDEAHAHPLAPADHGPIPFAQRAVLGRAPHYTKH